MNKLILYKKKSFLQYISTILMIGIIAVSCKKTSTSTQQFIITFNANGGEGTMTAQLFTKGKTQNLTANAFTRTGYLFAGWNTKTDGNGDSYTDQQNISIAANTTLYAQWGLPATGISLNKNATTLGIGVTEILTATVSPSNASNKTVSWISNDKNIATVDNNGIVSTKAKGIATITATTADGNYTASCIVTVKAFPDANFRAKLVSDYGFIEENEDINPLNTINQSKFSSTTSLRIRNSSISSLQGIAFFTALTQLDCENNSLNSLDISKNTTIKELVCYNNSLNSLDVSKNIDLDYLYCSDNSLNSLDVSKNMNLVHLYCNNNSLNSLDVSNNPILIVLYCDNNLLNSLDISKNMALVKLHCNNNSLNSLDVSKHIALKDLQCNNNSFNSLNIAMLSSLDMSIGFFGNQKNGINLILTLTSTQNNAWSIKDLPENRNITTNIQL